MRLLRNAASRRFMAPLSRGFTRPLFQLNGSTFCGIRYVSSVCQ